MDLTMSLEPAPLEPAPNEPAMSLDFATPKPARFEIISNNAETTLRQMRSITNNFNNIAPEYVTRMCANVNKRKQTWIGFIEAPADTAVLKQIIGKNGMHLKHFTASYEMDLIWHDRDANKFIIWGPRKTIIDALKALRRQIKRFILKQVLFDKSLAAVSNTMSNLDVVDMSGNHIRRRQNSMDLDEELPGYKRVRI